MGAIGYGFSLTDHRLGLVTPIEAMLTLWEEKSTLLLFEDFRDLDEILIDIEGWAEEKERIAMVRTPLLVSGVSQRGLKILKEELKDFDFFPVTGGGITQGGPSRDLIPGSSIAIQLARGDVNVSAIGTLTMREENRILALGHPFLYKGGGGYLLSGAYIHTLIDSLSMPFKLGSPTELKGTIINDRMAGVSGELYRYPSVVPLRITVLDEDRDQILKTNVQLVRDEDFLLSLSMVTALEAIDRAVDRIGRGTAQVRMELTAHGLPDKVFVRENIFNSQFDIASAAIMELGQILSLLTFNPFRDVEFIDMKLDIEVTREMLMATIQEIKVLNEEIYPGDELEIQVTLQPYRQKEAEIILFLDLPENINTGTATLSVMSGYESRFEKNYFFDQEDISGHAITSDYKDLESMLKVLKEQPKNNEIYLELWPQYRRPMEDEEEAWTGEENDRITEIQKTPYFLTGNLSTFLEILPFPEKEEVEKKKDLEALEVLD